MKEENQNSYTIQSDEAIGQVQIADEVVAIIAGLAATEVEGVASMAGNITNELVSKLGMKKLSKGNQGQRGQWRSGCRGSDQYRLWLQRSQDQPYGSGKSESIH